MVGGGGEWGTLNRGEARVGFPIPKQQAGEIPRGIYSSESGLGGRSGEDTCQSDQTTEKVAGRCGVNRIDRGAESEAWKLNYKARLSHRGSLFCLFLPSREAADPAQARV